jgi:hypothetical protein
MQRSAAVTCNSCRCTRCPRGTRCPSSLGNSARTSHQSSRRDSLPLVGPRRSSTTRSLATGTAHLRSSHARSCTGGRRRRAEWRCSCVVPPVGHRRSRSRLGRRHRMSCQSLPRYRWTRWENAGPRIRPGAVRASTGSARNRGHVVASECLQGAESVHPAEAVPLQRGSGAEGGGALGDVLFDFVREVAKAPFDTQAPA